MDDDTKKEIDALKRQIEDLTSKLTTVDTNLSQHTHKGNDGSSFIYNEGISLKPGQSFQTGNFGMTEYTGSELGVTFKRGSMVIGDDMNDNDGFDNAMITIEHQPSTDGSSNQTFYYGLRGKAYRGDDGAVTSGGTLFTTSKASFIVNSLVGETILVFDPANPGQFDGFTIASNTENTVTINGTWTFTGSGCTYMIFTPIYMGSAPYPWRRLYITQDSSGGIRFGLGHTNGGQNGLLYMDSATGSLKWRNPSGSTSTLGGGLPVGSIYLSVNSTNPSTTLGYGTWVAFGEGRMLVGRSSSDADFDTAEETGGEKTHTLIVDELPSHSHPTLTGQADGGSVARGDSLTSGYTYKPSTGNTGNNQAHNNMPPYIVVYMWKRTA